MSRAGLVRSEGVKESITAFWYGKKLWSWFKIFIELLPFFLKKKSMH